MVWSFCLLVSVNSKILMGGDRVKSMAAVRLLVLPLLLLFGVVVALRLYPNI